MSLHQQQEHEKRNSDPILLISSVSFSRLLIDEKDLDGQGHVLSTALEVGYNELPTFSSSLDSIYIIHYGNENDEDLPVVALEGVYLEAKLLSRSMMTKSYQIES
uniref:Uncharacterized protein n=1 Tax=Cucumis melo TaxID=3656 RepID=A0A9I9EDE2_CUCME